MVSSFRLALSFLTIIPVGRVGDPTPDMMGRLPGYYPLAGLLAGLLCWPVYGLLTILGMPSSAMAVFMVALLMILTRGFHLDGLADAADALLSHKPVEKKLEILKDSHLGTFGVTAIVLDVILKTILVFSADDSHHMLTALALYPVWGRLSASAVAVCGKNARDVPGLGYYMVENSRGSDLWLAVITAGAASLIFGLPELLAALSALVLGRLLVGLWRKSLGGVTGDLLGATVELGEIFSLTVFVLLIG
ncbi:MAG: adenosylcobinamide-GDP ribazoletransferase [Deltaproteobacteria bacterium]|jgi:adenosylcobinamide-GDP ribazoletransferase|nr:adenosylcobinamide-GDP ribazoletransferase [Deltaproteobacteria bacterium]